MILIIIIAAVFALPFLNKKIEHNLEVFLFVMGLLAVTVSNVWAGQLVREALIAPIKITAAVLLAGLLFRWARDHIRSAMTAVMRQIGVQWFFFLTVVLLGIFSSVITVIIASLILVEIVSGLKFDKKTETNFVVIACFSLGLGAALTPIGEPLSTIAVAKLSGAPYFAGFWFLAKALAGYILPGILVLGIFAAMIKHKPSKSAGLTEDYPETIKDICLRAGKVYIFVVGLIFLGSGLKPFIDTYLVNMPAKGLYWMNMSSAILDNATLTAAEITPSMDMARIRAILMGLLVAGGMLIPGNIPNIIAAGKLKISSRDWARIGVPLGLILMLAYFMVIFL